MILVEDGGLERVREAVGNYLVPLLFIETLNQASSLECKILLLIIISNADHTSVSVEKSECSNDCCKAIRTMEDFGMQTVSAGESVVNPEICCQGFGIICDGSSVIEISWSGRGLMGKFPESEREMRRNPKVSDSFKRFVGMKNLKKLNLSHNEFSGSFPFYLAETSLTDL